MYIRNILPILALGLVSSFANAAQIDFGIEAPTSGLLTYTLAGPDAGRLQGRRIDVDSIVGIDTPSSSGVSIACEGCILEFDTGMNTGGWNFGAGGTITITGEASGAGVGPNTTLLSGTFDNAVVVDVGGGMFDFKILGGSFFDRKDPDLLAHFGLPDIGYVGGLNISFNTVGNATMGQAFVSDTIFSGNVVNQPVPVPAAVWLFGSGLLGLVAVARRKMA